MVTVTDYWFAGKMVDFTLQRLSWREFSTFIKLIRYEDFIFNLMTERGSELRFRKPAS